MIFMSYETDTLDYPVDKRRVSASQGWLGVKGTWIMDLKSLVARMRHSKLALLVCEIWKSYSSKTISASRVNNDSILQVQPSVLGMQISRAKQAMEKLRECSNNGGSHLLSEFI